ncbi:hypothetical protein ABH927_005392, partial [Planotetraspora sp. GP83]
NGELRGATHHASLFQAQETQLTPAPLSLTRDTPTSAEKAATPEDSEPEQKTAQR